jgi:acetyltransferase-like isoleucine patch superfamily enzyme
MIYLKRYGFSGLLKHGYALLITKLFFRGARLIRRPIEIRGRSRIDFGKNLTTGSYCRIEAVILNNTDVDGPEKIRFGHNVILNDSVHIASNQLVTIGNNVLIASKVFITDHNHGTYVGSGTSPLIPPNERPISGGDVHIEDDVWIGEFVSIMPGVTIGKGSVIGATSVVTKSIPEYSIAVGIPAKVIKRYNFEAEIWEKI